MEVYVQAREILALFESLLNGAQLRRLMLLKEINNLQRSKMADLANRTGRGGPRSGVTFREEVLLTRPCMDSSVVQQAELRE